MRRRAVPVFRPRRRRRPIFLILTGLLVLLFLGAIVIVGGGYWYMNRTVPPREGTLQPGGLHGEVRVYWDERDVPHIEASHIDDVFYAQGFITARDRLWQMDLFRRVAAGRLAEVIGESELEQDKFFRILGFEHAVEPSLNLLEPETRAALEAYAAGVTAYIDEAIENGTLPFEFRLLGYTPEPWTPTDSLLMGRLIAYQLSGNWATELERYRVAQLLGWDAIDEWLPAYPDVAPAITSWPAPADEATDDDTTEPDTPPEDDTEPFPDADERLADLLRFAPTPFLGSNSWALAPDKTTTGGTLIANDPHMQYSIPALWHQVHLVLEDDFDAIGISIPGVPGVVFGRNEHIAWAITSLAADSQDLFIQRPNPDNPREFLYKGEWEPATVREELIYVKGQDDPVRLEVLETRRHGPVINPIVDEEQVTDVLSLAWTAFESTREFEALIGLMRATDFAAFETAVDMFDMPALSFLYADAAGNIGYKASGLLPVRPGGDGRLPRPAWDGEHDWLGTIPKAEMPRSYNPDAGFIVTANNLPADANYPHYIGDGFDPWRGLRITDVLSQRDDFDVADMQTLQLDVTNVHAEHMLPRLLEAVERRLRGATTATPQEEQALALLRDWDFVEDAEAAAPYVWHTWLSRLSDSVITERIGFSVGDPLLLDHMLLAMRPAELEETAWRAFQAAVDEAIAVQGDDPASWEWGRWHRMTVYHPIGESVPLLGSLLNVGDWALPGSGATPGVMGFDDDGLVGHGAAWRFVADMNTGAGYDVLLPGNSGHVLSPAYRDQADGWFRGELYEQRWSAQDYRQGPLLRLLPD